MNGMDRSKPKVIVLDVYETLLDMGDVERRVNSIMDSKRGYNLWMELFMQYCFVSNCTGQFNDFMSIARATMMMCGKTLGKNLSDISIAETLDLLSQLPLQEGVQEGLSDLNDLGFTIIALTNAPAQTVRERMEPSGLISYFEKVLVPNRLKNLNPA
jgi:2-haloacid dehalogenase